MREIKCDKCKVFIGSVKDDSHFGLSDPNAKLHKFCGKCKKEQPEQFKDQNMGFEFKL